MQMVMYKIMKCKMQGSGEILRICLKTSPQIGVTQWLKCSLPGDIFKQVCDESVT